MNFLDNIFKNINKNDTITGLNSELKGLHTFEYFKKYNKPIIYLTSGIYEATNMYQCLLNYTDDVLFFPMDDFLTSVAIAISPEFKVKRLETLNELLNDSNKILVTNLTGYLRFLPTKKAYQSRNMFLKVGNDYSISKIVEELSNYGYELTSLVNKSGEMAVRGFVVDIFPINYDMPIRIEFWGDTIERMVFFDVNSQLTVKKVETVKIDANVELLESEQIKENTIIDYMDNPTIIYDDIDTIKNSYEILLEEIKSYIKDNDFSETSSFMKKFSITSNDNLFYMPFDNNGNSDSFSSYNSYDVEPFFGSNSDICKRLDKYIKDNKTVIIVLSNRYKVNKLLSDLERDDIIFSNLSNIVGHRINVVIGNFSKGYTIDNVVVVTERELYNKKDVVPYRSHFRIGTRIRDLNRLSVGDYVVHIQHGIGKYLGLTTLKNNGLNKDYLTIEYAGGDKVYIPASKMELISKYSASDGAAVHLNKLGGIEWHKTKARIRKKIESIAADLLSLYSKRETSIGHAFKKDTEEQLIFESEFEFTETKDQLKAASEIKKDMERSVPMDRLLCGDVGYGKTEIAFRAAFKAMMDSKQVALLCPTTILSNQHYHNALNRFKSFPVNIALLNRFVSSKEKSRILKEVQNGQIDMLIGTHRILSDDVKFKNLGLLIIDEEQRFGVKHKEKIKQYKNDIDVLTLSATPIPRTLQMSMAGVRSLSLIETPPINRYPIQTYVLEENNQILKEAIYRELARNGQVFVLFNDIENIEIKKQQLLNLVPEAKIVVAHGKMNKTELENIMIDFVDGKYDVLLCTTIIETGIDIPNVNTLVVIDADHFGLSQLYQIRGRVGRSNKIAYCYLTYKKGKLLSTLAIKRLNVIKEFTELGSGFSIAMRDLSIRGAGDILGKEQAGFVDSVGIDLFLNMLNAEIDKLKGISVPEVDLNEQPLLSVSTAISDDYVSDETIKIEIHKKINSIKNSEDLEQVKAELEDRFGHLNEDLLVYMNEELFENLVKSIAIFNIKQTKNFIEITLTSELTESLNGECLFMDLLSINRKFRFAMRAKRLIIILDTINLDKHFIYYLIDMVDAIKNNIKK